MKPISIHGLPASVARRAASNKLLKHGLLLNSNNGPLLSQEHKIILRPRSAAVKRGSHENHPLRTG
jgi:hypothetical protein